MNPSNENTPTPQSAEPTPSVESTPTSEQPNTPWNSPIYATPIQPQQPPSQALKGHGQDPDYASLKNNSFSNVLNHLLKKPLSVIYEITHPENKSEVRSKVESENRTAKNTANSTPPIMISLLIITLVSLGIFGIVLGMFSGGTQTWATPLKVISGVFFSGFICLPSLYIFGSLGGMDAKIQHIGGLMLTFLAITSLLLVGFAPVVWLFSTSSNSIVFFGFLSLCIWTLSLLFGLRIINRASRSMGGKKGVHLHIWSIIFILVTLQMTTTLRPIIGTPTSNALINTEEKRFFLTHWFHVMDAGDNQNSDYDSDLEDSDNTANKNSRNTNNAPVHNRGDRGARTR